MNQIPQIQIPARFRLIVWCFDPRVGALLVITFSNVLASGL